ncbi:hypothetical protein Moror_5794 [Moniliophthora roreri MCA 2997]|uniref:Uncharacterized protein n=2 Tax=Moniliophthora roreri TaxID=221103 RepID=V2WK97_MONRO|nr:hypothetical protein Moror_5794 [Moniliophthora roreri MCA 2997]KAI3614965.1 hypothetical protein WG66_016911 [Moniliophthora roreri]
MSKLANIIGFSLFGLAARFGQLGIQKRNIFDNMAGHVVAMGVFGYGGYWAWRWDNYATELLDKKKIEVAENQKRRVENAEALAEKLMGRQNQESHS